jgi:hypothetical protein
MRISPETKELIRQLLGAVRPEIRELSRKLLNILPPQLRKEGIGRIIGFLAQRIEKRDMGGFQEAISDAIEIISDEIGKQVRSKARPEEIDELKEFRKMLENARERLRQAENVEEVRDRIIAELQAYESILEFFKTIEEKYVPKEEKKIDWEKIFGKLKEKYPEVKEEVKKQKNEFLRGLRRGWRRGRQGGLI